MEWKDFTNYGAKVSLTKATCQNQIMESLCALDNTQSPNTKGFANRLNKAFPIILKIMETWHDPRVMHRICKIVF